MCSHETCGWRGGRDDPFCLECLESMIGESKRVYYFTDVMRDIDETG